MDLNEAIVTPGTMESNNSDTVLNNCRGQLTIFFATTMILLITSIAFIINVGTFVKGKINLQNAVDAAAWSGAAVQSRLLTYIGYLNWELHNVHKELAYKYYVIGNRANDNVTTSMNGGGQMNFTLPAFDPVHGSYKDHYNIPTSCFNFARITTNLCTKLNVPGLPRFESAGVVGLDQTFKASVDSLTTSKSKNCADRSKINFAIALNWVYGDGKASFPQLQYTGVEEGRVGAWIRAMEIVFRIRNLESIMNLPPYTGGVCMSADGGNPCSTTVNSISNDSAVYERTVKSFWSSFRNIGNDSSMSRSFVLYELPMSSTAPKSKTSSEGVYYGDKRSDKYYVDLRLHLVNYAIFYTAFSPVSDNDIGITSEGACAGSKIALPIPFYPVGFVKSPNTLTYYAVKGIANFVGLFNPFGKPIKMEAYAAAKPFGGRIGPLNFKTNDDKVVARSSPPKSFPFASRIVPDAVPDKAGNPIPSDSGTRFWAESDASSIGGADKNNPRFVLLNTLYVDPASSTLQSGGNVGIYSITRGGNASSAPGLYDAYQYKKMRELPTGTAGVNASHMPTSYDALNYMIPLPYKQIDDVDLESVPVIPSTGDGGTPEKPIYYKIPAPLYGAQYSNMVQQTLADNALAVIEEFVSTIEAYSEAMAKTAQGYYNESPSLYNEAALVIHNKFKDDKKHPDCGSIAGNYYQYMTQPAGCDGQSLRKTVEDYFKKEDIGGEFKDYFTGYFIDPTKESTVEPMVLQKHYYSAYGPGNNYGGDLSGLIRHPFLQSAGAKRGLRNYYSTKFIPIKSLVKGGNAYVGSFPTFSDMADTASLSNPVDMGNVTFSNSLDSVDATNISQ